MQKNVDEQRGFQVADGQTSKEDWAFKIFIEISEK